MKIVSESDFNEAQRILSERSNEKIRKSNVAYTTRGSALLGGNIFCKHCGGKMYGIAYTDIYVTAKGERKVYKGIKYCCANRLRDRNSCSGMTQYLSKRVDDAVLYAVHNVLDKIKTCAKDDAVKRQYEKTVKEKKEIYIALKQRLEKEQSVLNKLISEVGKALSGESAFTIDILNASINASKAKITELEERLPLLYKEYSDKKEIFEHLDGYYDTLKGWSTEFDLASPERKKMIIGRLIDRIEIGKSYDITIKMNMNYEQFVG